MRTWYQATVAGVASAAMLFGAGCAPPAIDGGFDSENPSANLYAMVDAAVAGDRAAVPRIIEYLDSPDPAVRFFAIMSLQELTGIDNGYQYAAPVAEREAAIERWVSWIETDYPSFAGEPVDVGR